MSIPLLLLSLLRHRHRDQRRLMVCFPVLLCHTIRAKCFANRMRLESSVFRCSDSRRDAYIYSKGLTDQNCFVLVDESSRWRPMFKVPWCVTWRNKERKGRGTGRCPFVPQQDHARYHRIGRSNSQTQANMATIRIAYGLIFLGFNYNFNALDPEAEDNITSKPF